MIEQKRVPAYFMLIRNQGRSAHMKNSRGFTLFELMISVAIIGIMALIIAPNLVTGLPTYRTKAAVRDCTSQLRKARSLAIKEKQNITVRFRARAQRYVIDGREFPHAESLEQKYGSGVAFGRHTKSVLDGGVNFVAMSVNTPGGANAYPMVGPVIISEIMYNPDSLNTGDEYIELHNITGSPVAFADDVSTEVSRGNIITETVEWMFSESRTGIFPSSMRRSAAAASIS